MTEIMMQLPEQFLGLVFLKGLSHEIDFKILNKIYRT
jgi:hypothetical protein